MKTGINLKSNCKISKRLLVTFRYFNLAFQFQGHVLMIYIRIVSGWHDGAVGKIPMSWFQGSYFSPEPGLIRVWVFTCSRCVSEGHTFFASLCSICLLFKALKGNVFFWKVLFYHAKCSFHIAGHYNALLTQLYS